MSWRVIIRPNAEADLREAQSWYDSKRLGLGDEFLTEVGRSLQVVGEAPDRRPLYYKGFRRLITHRFPYKIFYQIVEDRVVVFRVLHAKRDHRKHL